MGLEINLDFAVPFNPNLNPPSIVRPYEGITEGLLGVFQLDNTPAPLQPVAGTSGATGTFSGAPTSTRLGYKFKNNDLIDTGIVPGSGLNGMTLFCVARKTGVVPSGAANVASPMCVGNPNSAAFRMELEDPDVLYANTAINADLAIPLRDDVSRFDLYVVTYSDSGSKMYRPRIRPEPVSSATTIANIGAAQLDQTFRIGTSGTGLAWAEAEVMVAGVFARALSDAEVLEQYAAMQAYAAPLGVIL